MNIESERNEVEPNTWFGVSITCTAPPSAKCGTGAECLLINTSQRPPIWATLHITTMPLKDPRSP